MTGKTVPAYADRAIAKGEIFTISHGDYADKFYPCIAEALRDIAPGDLACAFHESELRDDLDFEDVLERDGFIRPLPFKELNLSGYRGQAAPLSFQEEDLG